MFGLHTFSLQIIIHDLSTDNIRFLNDYWWLQVAMHRAESTQHRVWIIRGTEFSRQLHVVMQPIETFKTLLCIAFAFIFKGFQLFFLTAIPVKWAHAVGRSHGHCDHLLCLSLEELLTNLNCSWSRGWGDEMWCVSIIDSCFLKLLLTDEMWLWREVDLCTICIL